MGLYECIFGSYSLREIKRIKKKYINKINKLEKEISSLSDDELKSKTTEFKSRISNGELLDKLLPEAFAVCREASKRVLGMRHFDVQLIGGVVLHEGRIAEMKTGEGKTLVATLPAYLNALTGKGVHVVTVNDYLAQRDREIMQPLYDFLGVTTSVIVNATSQEERKESYNADIVYITNSELGFDYLKDNMVKNINAKVQRKLNYAIVDEVDSILIDEARTPLIISAPSGEANHLYTILDVFVKSLTTDDYEKDLKLETIHLTDSGITKAECVFGLENYTDIEHNDIRHHMAQALKANYGLKKDKDYIIKNNEIIIVDEFTGRLADGRRYSNGLHQAIEAKEGVKIQEESITLASITYQNFFKLYNKLSGMSGTAETEQQEFNSTYALDVVVIPTNLPIARKDKYDKLYMTEKAKLQAIVRDIKRNHEKGRPILVGTPTVEKSEQLSTLLNEENIPHEVLNAKFHEHEAQIIAKAGNKGSVTIATNMAGRGTDIKLSEEVKALGGLKIIGTERAENRRVDNQLRGRAGRQGDPGVSQFYLSLEDDLIRYATEKIKRIIEQADKDDTKAIKNRFLNSAITKCQKSRESENFEARKNTLQYDDVVNKQRTLIYEQRDTVLKTDDLTEILENMIKYTLGYVFDMLVSYDDVDLDEVIKTFEPEFFDTGTLNKDELSKLATEEIKELIVQKGLEIFKAKKDLVGDDFNDIAKNIMLTNVDKNWMENIDVLTDLKRDVKLIALKGEDPIHEYIKQSSEIFENVILEIQSSTIKYILKLNTYVNQPKPTIVEIDGVKITS